VADVSEGGSSLQKFQAGFFGRGIRTVSGSTRMVYVFLLDIRHPLSRPEDKTRATNLGSLSPWREWAFLALKYAKILILEEIIP
jgi:hypothetical protein